MNESRRRRPSYGRSYGGDGGDDDDAATAAADQPFIVRDAYGSDIGRALRGDRETIT